MDLYIYIKAFKIFIPFYLINKIYFLFLLYINNIKERQDIYNKLTN